MAAQDGKRQISGDDWLQVISDWPNAQLRAQERWSRLDPAALEDIGGRRERLVEQLREAYGVSEEEANRQVDDFVATHWGGGLSATHLESGGAARSNTIGARSLSNAAGGPHGSGDTAGARDNRPAGGKAGGN